MDTKTMGGRPGTGLRRALLSAAIGVGLVLVAVSMAWAAPAPQLTVITPVLNVRSGPGLSYPVIGLLRTGTAVDITGRNTPSGWWQVRLGDGSGGWVSGASDLVSVTAGASQAPEIAAPAAGSTGPGSGPGKSGGMVFQLASGGPIYVMAPDGAGMRQLTTGIDPALSPDGRQVAFTRWQNSGDGSLGSLWVINRDGSGERAVLNDVRQPKSPAWSLDGKRIAINMQQGGFLNPRRLCSGSYPPRNAYDITVDVDDQGNVEFCYTIPADPGWGLRLVNLADGSFQDLPRDIHSFAPTWDPANAWHLVYSGDEGLVNLDINRGATWPLTTDLSDRSPAFSPDGRKIAVAYHQHDHWEVHVMNADGSGRVRLTETPSSVLVEDKPAWNNTAPAWSPDGSQIAFLTDRRGSWEIWAMNADGSNQRLVKALPGLQYNGVDERVISWR